MLWKTRDGRVLDVKEMTDSHLDNTVAYMRRRVDAMRQAECSMWGGLCMLQGEMAQDAAESALEQVAEAIGNATYSLRGLEAEQKRRASTNLTNSWRKM